ncbi:unnamed protein product [Camellia sinensis]
MHLGFQRIPNNQRLTMRVLLDGTDYSMAARPLLVVDSPLHLQYSQATFGELKKMMTEPTRLHHEDQKLEMRKNATMEKVSKSISDISLEVDRLAGQVSALESVVTKGGKVAEKDLLNPTEQLMNQLLKLDAIIGDGDIKLQSAEIN